MKDLGRDKEAEGSEIVMDVDITFNQEELLNVYNLDNVKSASLNNCLTTLRDYNYRQNMKRELYRCN